MHGQPEQNNILNWPALGNISVLTGKVEREPDSMCIEACSAGTTICKHIARLLSLAVHP